MVLHRPVELAALIGEVKYWDGNRPLEARNAPKEPNPLYNARSGFEEFSFRHTGKRWLGSQWFRPDLYRLHQLLSSILAAARDSTSI
jgi:hypothetical protein